jgi:hypothetical protein
MSSPVAFLGAVLHLAGLSADDAVPLRPTEHVPRDHTTAHGAELAVAPLGQKGSPALNANLHSVLYASLRKGPARAATRAVFFLSATRQKGALTNWAHSRRLRSRRFRGAVARTGGMCLPLANQGTELPWAAPLVRSNQSAAYRTRHGVSAAPKNATTAIRG